MNSKGQITLLKIMVSFILIGMVVYGMIGFSISLNADNPNNVTLGDDDAINASYEGFESTITSSRAEASNLKNATDQSPIEVGETSLLFESAKSTITNFNSIVTGFYNLTIGLIHKKTGIPKSILVGFTVIFILTLVFLVYRTLRSGQ
jgi:hypothetical protein